MNSTHEGGMEAELASLSPAERIYCQSRPAVRDCKLFDIYPEIETLLAELDKDMRKHVEVFLRFYRTHTLSPKDIDNAITKIIYGNVFPIGVKNPEWRQVMDSTKHIQEALREKMERLQELRARIQPRRQ